MGGLKAASKDFLCRYIRLDYVELPVFSDIQYVSALLAYFVICKEAIIRGVFCISVICPTVAWYETGQS